MKVSPYEYAVFKQGPINLTQFLSNSPFMSILSMRLYKGIFGLFLVVLILTGVAAAEVVVSGSDVEGGVQGEGLVQVEDSIATVWASESISIVASPTPARSNEHYIYCIDIDGVEHDCKQGVLAADEGFFFDLTGNDLSTGETSITVRIHEDDLGYNNPKIEEQTFILRVITKNGDFDRDGLSNFEEYDGETDYENKDSDRDGLDDGEEVSRYSTDPVNSDTDGDGLSDGEEVNHYSTNPDDPDSDNDGLNDGPEVNVHGTDPAVSDTDSDGFDDGAEIQQGTDPNNRADKPTTEDGTDNQEDTDESGDQAQAQSQSKQPSNFTSDNSKDDGIQRGFFTNDSGGPLSFLNAAEITMIGFFLSIFGIVMQLRRGA